MFAKLAGRTAGFVGGALAVVALGVHRSVTGRHRAAFAPFWFVIAVMAAYWLVVDFPPVVPLVVLLIAVGLVFVVKSVAWGGTKLSRNEYVVVGDAFVAAAYWCLIAWATDGWHMDLVALAVLVALFATPWWAGRRIRARRRPESVAPKTYPHEVVRWWEEYVTAEDNFPELVGDWEWTPGEDRGVLHLHHMSGKQATRMTENIEQVLNLVPGTLRLEVERGRPARDLVVRHLPDVVGSENAVTLYGGQEIDAKGRLWLGEFIGSGGPVRIPLLRDNGGAHVAIVAGSGGGKGVLMRTIAIQLARADWIAMITLDGKHGQGLPALRAGSALFVDDLDDIGNVIAMLSAVVEERARRFGKLGQSGWRVERDFYGPRNKGLRGDPLLVIVLDETHAVFANITKSQRRALENVAAQGRSAGVVLVMLTQRADAAGLISTAVRNNVFSNGTTLVGAAGDSLSGSMANAGFGGLQAADLPRVAGWWTAKCRIGDVPTTEFRGGICPDAEEAEILSEQGVVLPPLLADDEFEQAVEVLLNPRTEAVMAEYGFVVTEDDEELPDGGVDEVERHLAGVAEVAQGAPGAAEGDDPELPGSGATRARACLPEDWESKTYRSHRRVLALLEGATRPLERGDIATELDLRPNWTSKVLATLRDLGLAEQKGGGRWAAR